MPRRTPYVFPKPLDSDNSLPPRPHACEVSSRSLSWLPQTSPYIHFLFPPGAGQLNPSQLKLALQKPPKSFHHTPPSPLHHVSPSMLDPSALQLRELPSQPLKHRLCQHRPRRNRHCDLDIAL